MADPVEEPHLQDAEEGGGPVKSFLEHLEDFRWLLVKTAAALGICFIVCLYAIPQIVWVLKWPLSRAALVRADKTERRTVVRLGETTVGTLHLETNSFGALNVGTNWFSVLQLEPVAIGTNIFLTLRAEPNPPNATMLKSATDLVYLDPSAPFLSSMSLAFYGGLLLSSPFIFFFIAQFVLPALRVKEKKYALRAAGIGVGLFLGGVAFCYFFVMARALKFAEWWAIWMGVKVPEWRAETYFSFVTKFLLGMGLGFELPVVLLALVKIGILDYARLAAMRRYMIVINLVLGALLTTPEVYTQIVMAVVLQVLYELSVWIAWFWEQPDRSKARRMLLIGLLLAAEVFYFVYKYGWPYLQLHFKH